MAEKANQFEELDLSKIDWGNTKLQLAKSGAYLSKYKMTISRELNDDG